MNNDIIYFKYKELPSEDTDVIYRQFVFPSDKLYLIHDRFNTGENKYIFYWTYDTKSKRIEFYGSIDPYGLKTNRIMEMSYRTVNKYSLMGITRDFKIRLTDLSSKPFEIESRTKELMDIYWKTKAEIGVIIMKMRNHIYYKKANIKYESEEIT